MKAILGGLLLIFSCQVSALDQDPAAGFDMNRFEGKFVYLDFWASWCKPCRASFPFMQALQRRHPDKLVVVAVNVDEKHTDAARFLADFETPVFNIVYDPKGKVASEFDLQGMPASFLFDMTGELIGTHIGFRKRDAAKLDALIDDVIATQQGAGRQPDNPNRSPGNRK